MKKRNNGIKQGETHSQWYQRLNNRITTEIRKDFQNIKIGNCVLFENGKTSFVSAVWNDSFEVAPICGLRHDPVLLYFRMNTSSQYPIRRSVFHADAGYEPVGFYSGQLQKSLFD